MLNPLGKDVQRGVPLDLSIPTDAILETLGERPKGKREFPDPMLALGKDGGIVPPLPPHITDYLSPPKGEPPLNPVKVAGLIDQIIPFSIAPQGQEEYPVFLNYRKELLEAAGHPTDPLELMLIEQAAVSHVTFMRMTMKATLEKVPDLCETYIAVAMSVMAETRRTIMATQEYRAGAIRERATKAQKQRSSSPCLPIEGEGASAAVPEGLSPQHNSKSARESNSNVDTESDFNAKVRRAHRGGTSKSSDAWAIDQARTRTPTNGGLSGSSVGIEHRTKKPSR